MGYERVELSAYSRVSKHNSPRDDVDAVNWNRFVAAVKDLAEQYDPELHIDVYGSEMPIFGWEE